MGNPVVDFFFLPYLMANERRLQASLADGVAHGSRIYPHDPLPGQQVTLLFSTHVALPVEHIAVYYTTDGTHPKGERGHARRGTVVVKAERGEIVQETEMHVAVRHWRAMIPAQPDNTLVCYCADGWNAQGEHWFVDAVEPVSVPPPGQRVFTYSVDRWTTPQWWHDAIVYQIYVDRFNAASDEPALRDPNSIDIKDFFGGTLRGILEKLDYIEALGVNCIWLSPIFESPTAHGYNASDYFTVSKHYGTNEIVRQLTDEAHRRGMRVMFDFAANHTSNEHAAFLAAQTSPDSPTREWYDFSTTLPHGYRSYGGGIDMPELRTDSPDVQHYLFDVALYWLRGLGADGLRLDYAPGPSHSFWTLFQVYVKTHVPDAVTLGELPGPREEIETYAGRIDAFMDFSLAQILRKTFALREMTLREMLVQLDERQLPESMSTATLLDNHDMHRFLWLADGNMERLKIAAICQMTLEGTPIVYYGTEVGLSQYDDAYKENAYARAPMVWGKQQNTSLLTFYQRLLAMRNAQPVLRHGTRKTLSLDIMPSDKQEQVGGYIRIRGQHFLLILLNNSEQEVSVRFSVIELLRQAHVTPVPTALHKLFTISKEQNTPIIEVQNGIVAIELAALDAAIVGIREEDVKDDTTEA